MATTTKIYEDAERIDWQIDYGKGMTCQRTEWKTGSPGFNQEQARDLIQAALENWGSLTAAQKDKLLRLLCRYTLGRFDGT